MDDQIKDPSNSSTGPQGPYQPVVPKADGAQPHFEGVADQQQDDSILQSASSEMGEEIGAPPPNSFKPKGGKGKKILLLLFVLLLIGGGAAAYYFLVYKKPAPEPAAETPAETPVVTNTFTPENIAYAFREKKSEAFSMYLRPVGGGDRVEAGKLGSDAYPIGNVSGQNIAVMFDNKLHVSTDGGKTYSQVLDPEAGQLITSARFNQDGTKLGVAVFNEDTRENTVSSMDIDGQNASKIFSSKDHSGINLLGWNDQNVIFDTFKPNSDGSTPNPYRYDVETKKSTKLIKLEGNTEVIRLAVSDDLSKLVYSTGKTANNSDDPFARPLAPHTITVVDIASGESEKIATVGKTGETAPNGTPLQRETIVGFMVNSTTPYYVDGKKLLADGGDTPTTLYAANSTIVDVQFVSDNSIIVATGSSNDFVLSNYDVATEATTTILEGDVETVLFGVTTK